MTSSTRARVTAATSVRPLRTLETVGMETPASAAIMAIVAVLPGTSAPATSSSGAAAASSALVVVMVGGPGLLVATIGPNVALARGSAQHRPEISSAARQRPE